MSLKRFWKKLKEQRKTHPVKWAMVIDLDKCNGCLACVQACRSENNVSYIGPEGMDLGRGIFWMEVIPIVEGVGSKLDFTMSPTPCFQCDNTPCIKYCPTHATETNREGITGQVYARCIGCRYCTVSCPYTRRFFNWFKPEIPTEMEPLLNPDVTVRMRGVVEKCNFCYHRINEAKFQARLENRELRDGDIETACQQTCPTGAITFGNLQDSKSEVFAKANKRRAVVKLEHLGTEPKVFYMTKEDINV